MLFHETFVSAPNLGRLHGEVTHCFFDSWSKCWAHVATCDAWNPFPFCSVTDMSQGYTASVNRGFIVFMFHCVSPQDSDPPIALRLPSKALVTMMTARWPARQEAGHHFTHTRPGGAPLTRPLCGQENGGSWHQVTSRIAGGRAKMWAPADWFRAS